MCRQEHTILSCLLLVCLGLHVIFSKSELHLTECFCFLGSCWDMVGMCLSLKSDRLDEIQQLVHSLLQTQSVTVGQVMSFPELGQFLCQWPLMTSYGRVMLFRVTCWMFIILQLTYFVPLTIHIQTCVNLQNCLSSSKVKFPCNFPFLMWLLLQMPHPLIRPSISGLWVTFVHESPLVRLYALCFKQWN